MECSDFVDINPKVNVGQGGKFIVTVPAKKFGLDNGLFVSVRCIQKIKKKTDKPIFVGVAGPSGSGKCFYSSYFFLNPANPHLLPNKCPKNKTKLHFIFYINLYLQ